MVTIKEVEHFLLNFKEKVKIYDIIYRDDRGKNLQTLTELDITPKYRKDVIMNLKSTDYSEGPIIDSLNHFGDMWVFGKDIKGQEVYIKITMGLSNKNSICISFHISEHKMNYPFKKI